MQNLTEDIERYILSLLDEEKENFISLRRKELAKIFECVPSQINYVLRSRFTPEQGYLIESRRGEHGYIKILRITCECSEDQKNHVQDLIGERISLKEAGKLLRALQKRDFITMRERFLIDIALKNIVETSQPDKYNTEIMLADILRRMLSGLMS
ncbi:MAG: CtsR family transcriptional regulator [Synergistaceae bacterium]|nr:CtsR family transcriptional regulator [Synergistaceae bacterium]